MPRGHGRKLNTHQPSPYPSFPQYGVPFGIGASAGQGRDLGMHPPMCLVCGLSALFVVFVCDGDIFEVLRWSWRTLYIRS